jgi:hypothetical protein
MNIQEDLAFRNMNNGNGSNRDNPKSRGNSRGNNLRFDNHKTNLTDNPRFSNSKVNRKDNNLRFSNRNAQSLKENLKEEKGGIIDRKTGRAKILNY